MQPIPLIDDLIADVANFSSTRIEIDGRMYVAKTLPYYHWSKMFRRLRDAWAVLNNRAIAVQFAEDRKAVRRTHN